MLPDVPALQTVDFLNGFNKKAMPFQSRSLLAGLFRTSRHALIFLKLLLRNRYFFSPGRSRPGLGGRRTGFFLFFPVFCVVPFHVGWRPVNNGTPTHAEWPTRLCSCFLCCAIQRGLASPCSRDANPRGMANATCFLFFVLCHSTWVGVP